MSGFAAVVLAGGAAARMGGAVKPAQVIGGIPLISRVLAAVADAAPRIVVGPSSLAPLLPADVLVTVEAPAGVGPVAALAAGLTLVPSTMPAVVVLAADLPFLTAEVVALLLSRLTADAAVLVDDRARPQWLCSAWSRAALSARLPADPVGRPMRALTEGAAVEFVTLSAPSPTPGWFDCDTDEDIRRAEELARGDARQLGSRGLGSRGLGH